LKIDIWNWFCSKVWYFLYLCCHSFFLLSHYIVQN
jgi:hypothetical protein